MLEADITTNHARNFNFIEDGEEEYDSSSFSEFGKDEWMLWEMINNIKLFSVVEISANLGKFIMFY